MFHLFSDDNKKMEVLCNVSNCKYYKDNYCTADKLEVNPMNSGFANSSDETVCTTFVPRDEK